MSLDPAQLIQPEDDIAYLFVWVTCLRLDVGKRNSLFRALNFVEQASVDMLLKAEPLPQSASEEKEIAKDDDMFHKLSNKPYWLQIEEAERLGLGSIKYEIIER